MNTDVLLSWSAVIIGVGSAVGVILGIIRPIVKKFRKVSASLDRFIEDWFGSDAAAGRDKVPGVMERLNNIDGELKHNGGSTMKDSVKRLEQTAEIRTETLDRIEKKLTDIDGRLDEGNKRFDELDVRLSHIENKDS
ncbi:hypothetical protein UFOVP111_115 [uncultured Caudovirales phage]|uniref:Uncharacterized protein n=1 Tax=uncultured Caudovirales phage TaxID=2100421 RepID=A0A6J5L6A9_9CAUD|nr:hypothetical protein UFOVP111_115 [uncultured Caudovirales phage]